MLSKAERAELEYLIKEKEKQIQAKHALNRELKELYSQRRLDDEEIYNLEMQAKAEANPEAHAIAIALMGITGDEDDDDDNWGSYLDDAEALQLKLKNMGFIVKRYVG